MGHLNGVLGITNFSNILQMTGDGIVKAGSKVQVTFHRSRVHCSIDKVPNHTLFPVELKEHFVKRIGLETLLMLFIYLYLGNLYSDLWKSDLSPRRIVNDIFSMSKVVSLLPPQVLSTTTLKYWPLKREVHVNHLLEHVQKLTKVTPIRTSPLRREQKDAVVTQCCNSSRKEHSFPSTKIVPVLLLFPLITVSPCLD